MYTRIINSVSRFSLISERDSNPRRLFALVQSGIRQIEIRSSNVQGRFSQKRSAVPSLFLIFSRRVTACPIVVLSPPRSVQSNSFRRSHPPSLLTLANKRVATKSLWIKMFPGSKFLLWKSLIRSTFVLRRKVPSFYRTLRIKSARTNYTFARNYR